MGILVGVMALGCEATALPSWDDLLTWRSPDAESWVFMATAGDSDEDAVISFQRSWRKNLGESRWQWGWEVGAGAALSGKYERTGALATVDVTLRRPIWGSSAFTLGVNGAMGAQVQSIEFPGGSYHNGRLGAYFDLVWHRERGRDLEWRLGYLHISNANLGPGNEGHDGIWLGGGWTW